MVRYNSRRIRKMYPTIRKKNKKGEEVIIIKIKTVHI